MIHHRCRQDNDYHPVYLAAKHLAYPVYCSNYLSFSIYSPNLLFAD